MRTRSVLLATLALLLTVSVSATAQGVGIAARAGTLGLGGEAALGLGDRLVIRGGVGVLPWEVEGTIDDIDLTLELPRTSYNVGADLYLTDAFRLGGGMLFRSEDVLVSGTPTTTWNIGGRDFTPEELGTLRGRVASGPRAPYVLLGFGKHTSSGIGLTLDLGAAFLDEPDVALDSEGGTFSDEPELRARLDAEERTFEEESPAYLNLWPILNLGLRIGVGG